MDRLSSCYFCGGALDDSLDEYPVVPEPLRPAAGSQKTVVLCGTCRRKLDAVLDTVVGAVEQRADAVVSREDAADDQPSASGVAADPSGSPADGETSSGETSSGGASESGEPTSSDGAAASDGVEATLGDDEEILRPVGSDADSDSDDGSDSDDAGDSVASDEGAADDDSQGEKERKYTDARGAGWRRDDDRTNSRGLLSSDSESGSDDSGADEPSDGASDAGTGGSDSAVDRSADPLLGPDDSGGDEADGDEDGAADGRAGDGDGDGDDGSTPDISLSRLENTKVMRLLENREYPVDAEEFVTVAANAYQISRDDCERVLRLADKHDLIRVEDGQIVDGDL